MVDDGVKQGILPYDKMVKDALLQVLRQSLEFVVMHGLPGTHHFCITFRTDHPDVVIPDYLRARYPDEMMVILQHQFWGLEVAENHFSVSLSFSSKPEQLVIPFAAVVEFADPSVRFGWSFVTSEGGSQEDDDAGPQVKLPEVARPQPEAAENAIQTENADQTKTAGGDGGAENIVALDRFRKK